MSRIPFHRWLFPCVLAVPVAACAGRAAAQTPRPFDPLTPAERQEAIRLATAEPRVREIAGSRAFDVASVELMVAKPEGATGPVDPMRLPSYGRQAEVLISVFEGEFTGIRTVVDLRRHAVAQVARLEGPRALAAGDRPQGAAVPFSPREVELARGLVRANERVRAFTGPAAADYTLEYLPISTPEPELCPSGRCLEVLFRRGLTYLTTTAVVDIPSQQVRMRGPQR